MLACLLTGLLALPAGAQETPSPTPSPSPTTPAPSPTPSPQTVQPDSGPDRTPQRKKRRHTRKKSRTAVWKATPRAKAGCRPFSHTQTYMTWGPALAYDEPVTVVYEASHCSKPAGRSVELSMQGTATVYRGNLVEGTPIQTRPFTVTGMWDRPDDPSGWPPTWWACEVKQARYTWEIAGVYTFDVGARWGVWNLEVTSLGTTARTVRWTHNACS